MADTVRLYRFHGPALYARCLRVLGKDEPAAAATPRAFARLAARLPDDPRAALALIHRAADDVCLEAGRLVSIPVDDPGHPTAVELEAGAAAEHAADCPRCRRLLDEARAARERFAREVFQRTRPIVERDARAPAVLRWVWVGGPLLVAAAMFGMVLAARSARTGDPTHAPIFAVYAAGEQPLATGARVARGERLRLVLSPAGHRWAAVLVNARVHARLGPLDPEASELEPEPLVADEPGPMRLTATFGPSARGLPTAELSIVVEVE